MMLVETAKDVYMFGFVGCSLLVLGFLFLLQPCL